MQSFLLVHLEDKEQLFLFKLVDKS